MGAIADIWSQLTAATRRILWDEPSALPAAVLIPARVALLTVASFRANRLGVHASGLAFYLLLSVVPLFAFLFLILKLFHLPEMLRPFLLEAVTGGNLAVVEKITEFIDNSQSATLGSVGVATLFVIGFLVLQRVKVTLNLIWRVEKRPGYASRILEYLAALLITPVLLVGTFTVSTFLANRRFSELLPDWALPGEFPISFAEFSGFAIITMVVLYAYLFLPDTRVEWPGALLGALGAGAALRLAQIFYIQGVLEMSNYNLVYGALVFFPLLMIWFYLAWVVFLFGAQFGCVMQNYAALLEQRRLPEGASTSTPYAGLLVLIALLREFQRTGAAASARAILRASALPKGAVDDGLRRLTEAELITRVPGRPLSYVPRETPERWNVARVLRRLAIFPHFSEAPLIAENAELAALKGVFHKANTAMARPLERLTLLELAGLEEPTQDASPTRSAAEKETDEGK